MKTTHRIPPHQKSCFRPARHCAWAIGLAQAWTTLDLAWHNRLHLDPNDLAILTTIPKGCGLILAANHCDETDPKVLFELSRRSRRRFSYMMNAEAFEEWHGLAGWLLQWLGVFSVERSDSDQTALRYAIGIVKSGDNALVMFPEGEISYLNDLVRPFKTGTVHIGLQAVTESRETSPSWTTYLLPVAIKYRYRGPIGPMLNKKIRAIEKHLFIRASLLTFQEKIIRIMAKIIQRKEMISRIRLVSEQFSRLKEEIQETQASILARVETEYPQVQTDPRSRFTDRAQKMISFLRKQLEEKKLFSPETRTQLQKDIKDLKGIIQMSVWQPQYIAADPSEERLAETVIKLERKVFKLQRPRPLGRRDVFVRIAPPLDLGHYAGPYHKAPSAISRQVTDELRHKIQSMIEKI